MIQESYTQICRYIIIFVKIRHRHFTGGTTCVSAHRSDWVRFTHIIFVVWEIPSKLHNCGGILHDLITQPCLAHAKGKSQILLNAPELLHYMYVSWPLYFIVCRSSGLSWFASQYQMKECWLCGGCEHSNETSGTTMDGNQ